MTRNPRRSMHHLFTSDSQVSIFCLPTSSRHCDRQRPLLSRELPSAWPAPLWIDRGAPWRKWTGRCGFVKPCHAQKSFDLPKQILNWKNTLPFKPNICLTFSSLGIWNDVEWWQLLGSAGESLEPPWQLIKALNLGCPWQSAVWTLSNQNLIALHTMPRTNENIHCSVILLAQPQDLVNMVSLSSRTNKITAKLMLLADHQSYSPSRQQIPNSKFPCSIPVLGIHHPFG